MNVAEADAHKAAADQAGESTPTSRVEEQII
jgi:hypothetical protein